jgi:peroxiredoxin
VARKLEAPFPVLADPARRAYRAYGFTKSLWVIQQSGWVLIDRDGIVRHVSRNTNPQNSFDEDEVLQAVKSLDS